MKKSNITEYNEFFNEENRKAEMRGPLNCFTIASITRCHSEKQKLQVPFGSVLLQEKG